MRPAGPYTAAVTAGDRQYAGKPCPKHPGALRYVANKRCSGCVKAERLARARAKAAAKLDPFADLLG